MDAGFAKGILGFVPGRRKEAADAGDKYPHWYFWQHPCSGTCQIWRPGLEMQLLKPALTQGPACCVPTSCHFSSQNFLSNLCFSIPHCPFQIQVCVSWQWLLWVLFPPSQLLGNGNCDVPRAVQTHQKALTSLQESLQHAGDIQAVCKYTQMAEGSTHRNRFSIFIFKLHPKYSGFSVDGSCSCEWHRVSTEEHWGHKEVRISR